MAVPTSSPLRRKTIAGDAAAEEVVAKSEAEEVAVGRDGQSLPKRTNNPGVRVIGNRVYSSEFGKTCHQCRQKTLDFAAECKNLKKQDKQCTIKFCQKCLMNRYGEKASEVAQSDDWQCPKCRGICNCSFCMKKRGCQPTGILVHTAKKTGFSSVSEMLNLGNPTDLVKTVEQSPHKPAVPHKQAVVSLTKLGKENSIDKDVDSTNPTAKSFVKSSKKRKSEGLKEIPYGSEADGKNVREKKKCPKEVEGKKDEPGHRNKTKKKLQVLGGDSTKEDKPNVKNDGSAVQDCLQMVLDKQLPVEVLLPKGTPLTSVADVEFPAEAVGDALQFLEFCASFGQILDLRKGQAESLLRELASGRRRRTGSASVVARFHMQLLSFLQDDTDEESASSPNNGKSSWLRTLKEFAAESQNVLRDITLDCLDGGAEDYDNLDILRKLRLLNCLCDEVLNTDPFRTYIEEQNTKFIEDGKEAKEKHLAAKTKERDLKQKLHNATVEAILVKDGAPLTASDHQAIISRMKDEIALAHADVLQTAGKTTKKQQRSDAVSTEPLFLDLKGNAFWKLKTTNGESDVLLQELGSRDTVGSVERWCFYEPEKKQEVDTYISMAKRRKVQVNQSSVSDSEQQDKIMA